MQAAQCSPTSRTTAGGAVAGLPSDSSGGRIGMELYTVKEMATRRRIAYHRLLEWIKDGWVQGIPKDPSNDRSQKLLTDELMDEGLKRVAREVRKGQEEREYEAEQQKQLRTQLESGDAFLARLTGRSKSKSTKKKTP